VVVGGWVIVDESVFRGHDELVYGCLKKMNEW
jgi:hypothetical protein